MSRLKITLRAHVVVDIAQIEVELFAIKYVLALKASNQARLFYILHCAAKFAVAEDRVAFKLDFDDANAVSFVDYESERRGRGGNLVASFLNGGVWMPACSQQFFQHADRIAGFDGIVNAFLGDTDASFAKSLEHV